MKTKMLICWFAILGVMLYKFPVFTSTLVLTGLMLLMMIAVVRAEEKSHRSKKYYLSEFNQEMLGRLKDKVTKGSGIHLYRFIRDPKLIDKRENQDNYLGAINFNDREKSFTVDLMNDFGEFYEVLILDPRTLIPVKVIPKSKCFTISCDPFEFNSVQVLKGKYLIWLRTLGLSVTPETIENVFVSRDPLLTETGKPKVSQDFEFESEPEQLKSFAIDIHHDLHTRTKISEVGSICRDIFPQSPYIKAFHLNSEIFKSEIAYLFFENYRYSSVFHSLKIQDKFTAIPLESNSKQLCASLKCPDESESVKVEYTQFIFNPYRLDPEKIARPFLTRYSGETSHFFDSR